METKSFTVADVLGCSATADKMRREIETVTCLLINLIGRHKKHICALSVSVDGEWYLYQNGATYARYVSRNREVLYEMGDHGPRLYIQNVAQVHAELPHFITGMLARFDGTEKVLSNALNKLLKAQ